MAYQVLTTYVAHDVRHDLESAIWLLLCMVLRHTKIERNGAEVGLARYQWYRDLSGATTEKESAMAKRYFLSQPLRWKAKGNQPLTDLILTLKKLVLRQNRDQEADDERPAAVPMTHKSVLTEINRALASPNWPANDAALPFMLPLLDDSGSGSESKGRKHPREEDDAEFQAESDDAEGTASGNDLPRRPAKRLLGASPLRNDIIEPNPLE